MELHSLRPQDLKNQQLASKIPEISELQSKDSLLDTAAISMTVTDW
jgi:hypothetical protein